MVSTVEKQDNFITSYVSLSGVFHPYCRVCNNRAVIIIQFVLKSFLCDACMRLMCAIISFIW